MANYCLSMTMAWVNGLVAEIMEERVIVTLSILIPDMKLFQFLGSPGSDGSVDSRMVAVT